MTHEKRPGHRHGIGTGERIEDAVERIAREEFGLDELREGQGEAMSAVAAGRDVLAVMPTGHGKSAIYQVPALLRDGVALVISPLIALQADQAEALDAQLGEGSAVAVNSALGTRAVRAAWDAVEQGSAHFLFLAPEQLARRETRKRLADLTISLIAVDEAHCVSAWGHDFRPDYLRLGPAIEELGHPPVVALTATASPSTRAEIVERLGLREVAETVQSFDRPTLHLAVTRHRDDDAKRAAVADQVAELATPGLLYAATRKDTERYAAQLAERGLTADAYHAGRSARDRDEIHRRFLAGELDVVAATTAFGMGIDKPDVRFVVHAQVPDSLDSYYQQIGRAGRDGEPAVVHLHYRPEDLGLQRFFATSPPDEKDVAATFAAIRDHGPIRATGLRERTGLSTRAQTRIDTLLEHSGSVTGSRAGFTAVDGTITRDAVESALAEAESRTAIDDSRLERMRTYAETTSCRRHLLLTYFGEDSDAFCGACDICDDTGEAELRAQDERRPDDVEVQERVVHREFGPGTVLDVESDRLTVYFEAVGYRDIALEAIRRDDGLLRSDPDAVPS